jgi:hypothetical protein
MPQLVNSSKTISDDLARPSGRALGAHLTAWVLLLLVLSACSAGARGSVERASHDPAEEWGTPDVYDDFSGTNPEFELDNRSGAGRGWYGDGRFNITFPSRGWWVWYSGSASAMDFFVDVVVYNGEQCAERDSAGLVYRYTQSSDAGILFGISCAGGYFNGISGALGAGNAVCMFTNASPTGPEDLDCSTLWTLPTSPHINDGPGAANRLGVKASGTQITLYINGHEVESITVTPSIPQYGEFALYLGSSQSDQASASFDDFSLWLNP